MGLPGIHPVTDLIRPFRFRVAENCTPSVAIGGKIPFNEIERGFIVSCLRRGGDEGYPMGYVAKSPLQLERYGAGV
jgi:hypothetical protein